MKPLGILISNEYKSSLKSKSFWISTFIVPIIFLAFGLFVGFLAEDSKALQTASNPVQTDNHDMSGIQVLGLISGTLLILIVMTCGAQIFAKVKTEKNNRIMEIIATTVPGRTMMLAKVIGCGLVAMTQILIWGIFTAILVGAIIFVAAPDINFSLLLNGKVALALFWTFIFFIGGYLFYGSLYAAFGALSDKNNENQEYMTILTFILLASFYISQYSVDNPGSTIAQWCSFIPFTSSSISLIRTICEAMPLWQTILSAFILYAFSFLTIGFAGKIYTAGILMRGTKLKPKEFITFFKLK